MNYRHAFHAGNFADVLKHATLMRVLAHLARKETPFRVIDIHAGDGMYDLRADEANRTGEWVDGIGRLRSGRLSAAAEAILAPYRSALAALAPLGDRYPGSPALIRHALRPQDRANFNELHPDACQHLHRLLGRDERIAITALDAYLAWKAQVPPPERRGLVLVDPPFEQPGEFDRMVAGLGMMARKWPTGTAMLWYPVKEERAAAAFEASVAASGFAKLIVLELHVDAPAPDGPLVGSGLVIANPPWLLADDMAVLMPELSALLARGRTARWRVDWLQGP